MKWEVFDYDLEEHLSILEMALEQNKVKSLEGMQLKTVQKIIRQWKTNRMEWYMKQFDVFQVALQTFGEGTPGVIKNYG